MQGGFLQRGFTIVELLVVIVVIGILAAITVASLSFTRDKARQSVVESDFSNNNKLVQLTAAGVGNVPRTLDILQSGNNLAASDGIYELATYCSSAQSYALAAQTSWGDVYYSIDGGLVMQDNGIDVTNACASLGIASANRIFLGMPSSPCANENGTCSFSGTASVAYGSLAQGRFTAMTNLTSPVSCRNTFFGDPASGFVKACYVLEY